jgi:hypothetical protein
MASEREKTDAFPKLGCSLVQQEAELAMLAKLLTDLGRTFGKKPMSMGDCTVSLDGYEETADCITLVEVWAHVGATKPAQRNKVRSDMLKLALVKAYMEKSHPKVRVKSYLVFADDSAKTSVLGAKSWASLAATEFGIEARKVDLPSDIIEGIKKAQQEQDNWRR